MLVGNGVNLLTKGEVSWDSLIESLIRKTDNKLECNCMHEKLVGLNPTNIITTNYDFCLKKALRDTWPDNKINFKIPLKVKYTINSSLQKNRYINFWHIHGDLNLKERIVLGYDEYGNSIKQIDEYFAEAYKSISNNIKAESVKERDEIVILNLMLDKLNNEIKNIVEIFFTKDIYILGLGLEVQEMDLWWLINKRARYSLKCTL